MGLPFYIEQLLIVKLKKSLTYKDLNDHSSNSFLRFCPPQRGGGTAIAVARRAHENQLDGIVAYFPHLVGHRQSVKLLFCYLFSHKVGFASVLLIHHPSDGPPSPLGKAGERVNDFFGVLQSALYRAD